MAEERELKFAVDSLDVVRERLADLGAEEQSPASHERNWVFDRNDELRDAGSILRLRTDGQGVRLTLKGPVRWEAKLKIREETELEVGDATPMRKILESMGYSVIRRYEKIRQEWRLEETILALDHTPIGDYVELEGGEAAKLALRLGFRIEEAESLSYLGLYDRYRLRNPDSPLEMLFP